MKRSHEFVSENGPQEGDRPVNIETSEAYANRQGAQFHYSGRYQVVGRLFGGITYRGSENDPPQKIKEGTTELELLDATWYEPGALICFGPGRGKQTIHDHNGDVTERGIPARIVVR